MTATQGDLASLSRYIFRAPSWYSSAGLALVLGALTGIAAFDSAFVLEDAWQGVFFVGLPTVAAGLVTPYVDGALGGRLTADRSSLLALTCELLVIALLVGAGSVTILFGLGQAFVFNALLIALAAIFGVRLLIVAAVSRHSLPVSAIPASIQTVAAAGLLFVYSGTVEYLHLGGHLTSEVLARPEKAPAELAQAIVPLDFVLLGVMCLLHGLAVAGFLVVIDIPWRRGLGVSVLDFIQGFVGHLAEGSRELESFFEEIGEDALVPVTVLSARRPDGGEKARFVLPMIHPGPMGDIGGGNLPVRIAEQADGLGFPPHATAGHDFNLVTEREVDTVCAAVDQAASAIEYGDTASKSTRLTEGDATVTGQAFGEDVLAVSTFAPGFADDVAYSVGLSARSETRCGGVGDVLLVDAHNSNNGLTGEDLGHVVPGSERSFDLIDGAGRLGERLGDAAQHPVELGIAWDRTPWDAQMGIGPLGIRVAVFAVGGQTTAYVLVDGNNMEPGLRDRIVETVDAVDRLEVMTSDTHIVNTVEAENQVGQNLPADELVALVDDLVVRAVADCEPVEVGMASEKAEVTVFGNDRTETLASTANAMVSMGGAFAIVVMVAVLAMSVLIFLVASAAP
ncbi:DUF2070 family protein [Halobacteriales archaeon Cl-PHB]